MNKYGTYIEFLSDTWEKKFYDSHESKFLAISLIYWPLYHNINIFSHAVYVLNLLKLFFVAC